MWTKNKYHAKKVITEEGTFDSQKEYDRWVQLKLLYAAGKISKPKRQIAYELIPSQKNKEGKVIERPCKYIADFVYKDFKTGKVVVEDTKGMRLSDYIIKRKLMLWLYNIAIKEI